MFLQLLTLSSLMFAQPSTPAQPSAPTETVENLSVYRVDYNKHTAVVSTTEFSKIRIGDEYKIQTPDGACHTNVTEVMAGFIYVNIEQCRNEDVQKGTRLVSTRTTAPERQPADEADDLDQPEVAATSPYGSSDGQTSEEYDGEYSEFVNKYIAKKLSVYVGYHAGKTLDGQFRIQDNSTITEMSGANTIGLGAEYEFARLPYRLSAVGGFSYNLPRSYGEYNVNTTSGTQRFDSNPELTLLSVYLNVRYHFMKDAFFFMGLNRLMANMSNLPGSTSGDFGFHAGGRYYFQRIFVDGSINFYNLNYSYQGTTTDVGLTELEIKGGYTF